MGEPVLRIEPARDLLPGDLRLWWRVTQELLAQLEAQEKARTAAANSDPGTAEAKGLPQSSAE